MILEEVLKAKTHTVASMVGTSLSPAQSVSPAPKGLVSELERSAGGSRELMTSSASPVPVLDVFFAPPAATDTGMFFGLAGGFEFACVVPLNLAALLDGSSPAERSEEIGTSPSEADLMDVAYDALRAAILQDDQGAYDRALVRIRKLQNREAARMQAAFEAKAPLNVRRARERGERARRVLERYDPSAQE